MFELITFLINRKFFILLLLLLLFADITGATENYAVILAESDKARGYYDGLTLNVSLQNKKKYKRYYVMISGYDFLAVALAPEKYKGNKILMSAGNMWLHKVGFKNITPIPKAQRLIGDASYGEIISTNFSQNYNIELVTNEILNNKPCWLFILKSKSKSKSKSTIYDKIYCWIEKSNRVAIKSNFLAVSGKILKTAEMKYQQSLVVNQIKKPLISKITIIDKIQNASTTTIEFTSPIIKTIPPHYFKVNSFYKEQYHINN